MNPEIQAVINGDSPGCIVCGDCLEVMAGMPDGCTDAVVTDPPYGQIAAKWDTIVDFPFDRFGCSVVFCAMPYTAYLGEKYKELFKHHWIWDKALPSGFQIAKYRPMKQHEDILVFGKQVKYQPIMAVRNNTRIDQGKQTDSESSPLKYKSGDTRKYTHRYPTSILRFSNADRTARLHPTQKPVPLLEYLVTTYSTLNNIILDPFCGSGTTLVAAKKLGRRYIGIEISPEYADIARKRVDSTPAPRTIEGKPNPNVGKGPHTFF